MEKVVGEQGLALQQHFSYTCSKFSENSNCRINLLFDSRELKLGHFGIFDTLFPFLPFFKLQPKIFKKFSSKYLVTRQLQMRKVC